MLKKSLLILLAGLVFLLLLRYSGLNWSSLFHGSLRDRVATLQASIQARGEWKYLLYLLLFATLPLLAVPVSALCVVAGLVFRPWEAAMLIWCGSLACSVLTFVFARGLGRGLVERLFLKRLGFLQKMDQGAGRHGVKIALLSRFLPFPFAFAGFAAGLSRMRLRDLLAGTALAMIPWAVFYALFSHSVAEGSAASMGLGLVVLAVVLAASWKARSMAGYRPGK